jgi:hypothetical protein
VARKRAHNYGYRHYGWWDRIPVDKPVDIAQLANLLEEVSQSHRVTVEPVSSSPNDYRAHCSGCELKIGTEILPSPGLGALLAAIKKHGIVRSVSIRGHDLRECAITLGGFEDCEISLLSEPMTYPHTLDWSSAGPNSGLLGKCPFCKFTVQVPGGQLAPVFSDIENAHWQHAISALELLSSHPVHGPRLNSSAADRRHESTIEIEAAVREGIFGARWRCSKCDQEANQRWLASSEISSFLDERGKHGRISRISVDGVLLRDMSSEILAVGPFEIDVVPRIRTYRTSSASMELPGGHRLHWWIHNTIVAFCSGCEFAAQFDPSTRDYVFQGASAEHLGHFRNLLGRDEAEEVPPEASSSWSADTWAVEEGWEYGD